MWSILKVFFEFVTILLLFYVLVFWTQSTWDLCSPNQGLKLPPMYWKAKVFHQEDHQGNPYISFYRTTPNFKGVLK